MPVALRSGAAHGWRVLAGYAAGTVLVTWPLAAHLTTSIGGDYGDSTLNTWIVAWVTDHLASVLAGDLGAWTAMWTTPTFAPETATLTYSEHLIGQAIQALPLAAAGADAVTAYNAVLLATIALTGVAAHGLVFRLSGSHRGALVAGVLCAFNEYRFFWSLGHIQTLSIHWWIFGLWGLDVFVERRSIAALTGATLSLVLLHLSSSYLTAYAAPFTAVFALWSMTRHGRLLDRGVWAGVLSAGAISVAAVAPILARYLEASAALGASRPIEEIAAQSATITAYGQIVHWFGPLVALGAAGVVVSPTERGVTRRGRAALFLMAAAAVVLSFGPNIQIGDTTWPGPYRVLIGHVPGFSGLRVPHRYLVLTITLLSVLAGFAGAWAARWRSGLGLVPVAVAVAVVTRTAWSAPFPLDRVIQPVGLEPPPAYLRPTEGAPAVYAAVGRLPLDAVTVEFPFGEIAYEVRYTFFTRAHRHRTLNGYSGVLPSSYLRRHAILRDPLASPNPAWAAIAEATHVVVHPAAWPDDTGARVRAWLESRGATVVDEADGAWLLELGARGSGPWDRD